MPVDQYLVAAGRRRFAGQAGILYANVGQLHVSKAPTKGVDENLWAVLKTAVDTLRLALNINSIDTGKHVPTSRHYTGRAVDINKVGAAGTVWRQATLHNSDAMRLVRWLQAHGFRAGEGGPWPAVIFGPPHSALNPTGVDHSSHLHVSLPLSPGDAGDEEWAEPEAVDAG